jgi:hypothetical protein
MVIVEEWLRAELLEPIQRSEASSSRSCWTCETIHVAALVPRRGAGAHTLHAQVGEGEVEADPAESRNGL